MIYKERILKKVTFEYDNGEIEVIDENAQKWNEDLVSVCQIAQIHNMGPDWSKYNFKKIGKKD